MRCQQNQKGGTETMEIVSAAAEVRFMKDKFQSTHAPIGTGGKHRVLFLAGILCEELRWMGKGESRVNPVLHM